MAAYTFLASEPTLQVLSPELVRDAQRVTASAVASGVVYSLLFAPYPTDPQGSVIWSDELIAEQLALWADYWNQNAAVPGVAGIGVTQEVDAAGALKDVALVTVTSASGRSSAQVTVPAAQFLPERFAAFVAPTVAQLNAVEAG